MHPFRDTIFSSAEFTACRIHSDLLMLSITFLSVVLHNVGAVLVVFAHISSIFHEKSTTASSTVCHMTDYYYYYYYRGQIR
jgi:hypothetical protein